MLEQDATRPADHEWVRRPPADRNAVAPARGGGLGPRRQRPARALAALAAAALLLLASPASADRYDPKRSAHPLRVIAYAVHPVGVILDTLIARPAHWLVHHEPLKTLFGHTE
jgi:hypothetical protein